MKHPGACVGIDVSKLMLDAALYMPDQSDRKLPHKRFKNSGTGISQVLTWARTKSGCVPAQLRIIMEPTQFYHLSAAHAFKSAGCEVIVCNPWRARSYALGTGSINKTDKCDARALAAFGLQAGIRPWVPMPTDIVELRWILKRLGMLDREIRREALRKEPARVGSAPEGVLESLRRVRAFQQGERQALLETLESFFARHPKLCHERELLMTIPCIGPMIGSRLLCLLRSRSLDNARQAAALTGLVPVHSVSGTSLSAKARMSRAGDVELRSALYMPAIGMIGKGKMAALYAKLISRGLKPRQAIVAVMRKTVHIAFGVLKHQQPYVENYQPGAGSDAAKLTGAPKTRAPPPRGRTLKRSKQRKLQPSDPRHQAGSVYLALDRTGLPILMKSRRRKPAADPQPSRR